MMNNISNKLRLVDGTMLETAVLKFKYNRTEETGINFLKILACSEVWVPCNCVLSGNDQKRFEDMVNGTNGDYDSLVNKTFETHDQTRLVPDILQNGEDFFFPIFSSEEAMGEYGSHFSKVPSPMSNILCLARNNDKKLAGIVLNAFTEPVVVIKEVWDILEEFQGQLQ